jgi:hypothetical protein
MHVGVLTHMHQDFEKKMTEYAGLPHMRAGLEAEAES